ncbi:MAG: lipid-A-disaccharide synthase [bacterium]
MLAGEPSGDLHAAALVRAMRRRCPRLRFTGLGGDRLQDEGVEILHHTDQLAVMGFAEVVRHLPRMLRVMGDVRSFLHAHRPRLMICVDYPGMNLRVAREAAELGIPVLYYIAPQVWAWHEERVRELAEFTDVIGCVLPFEPEFFRTKGAELGVEPRAEFVGHPLVHAARPRVDAAQFRAEMLLPPDVTILALLPGSREQEVSRLLPPMLEAMGLLRRERPGLVPILCAAPGLERERYEKIVSKGPLLPAPAVPDGPTHAPGGGLHIVAGRTYDVLNAARGALVASGTATLETGLLGIPMVIAYRMSPLSWRIGRARVKVPHVGLVNLVAGERVVPELLQEEATPGRMAAELGALMDEGPDRHRVLEGLAAVRAELGEEDAPERGAELAMELLEWEGP